MITSLMDTLARETTVTKSVCFPGVFGVYTKRKESALWRTFFPLGKESISWEAKWTGKQTVRNHLPEKSDAILCPCTTGEKCLKSP